MLRLCECLEGNRVCIRYIKEGFRYNTSNSGYNRIKKSGNLIEIGIEWLSKLIIGACIRYYNIVMGDIIIL